MDLNVNGSSYQHSSMEKHIASLRKSVQQTKCAIARKLQKSEHRFKEEINKCKEEEKKTSLLKKLDKISKELQILDDLSDDDIVKFALTTHHNMMAVACNRRCPETQRMKARIASHKPLSIHLARIKSKLKEKKESENEEKTEPPATSMNKMSVNNQIVKMRKIVKQSKVHIIHKLTRKIKNLREAKGKNKEKCEKRADGLVKKLKCIKELNEDEISRFALTSTQDLAKLSLDMNAPLKSHAMAAVAIHKFVADSVAHFKNTYPDLHKNILTVLKKNKHKRKLIIEGTESEQQFAKQQNKKIKGNIMNRDSDKSVSKNKESSEEESDDKESGKSNESDQIGEERENSELEEDTKNNNNTIFDENESDISEKCSDVDNDETSDAESDKLVSIKIKNKNFIKKSIHKKDTKLREPLIKISSGKETDKTDDFNTKHKKLKKSKRINPITPKVVDPFFVTSTNEDYVTSQVPSIGESEDTDWKVRKNSFEPRESNKFYKNNRNWGSKQDFREQSTFGMHHYKKPSFYLPDESPKFNKYSSTNIIGNRKERRKALHQPVKEEKTEKLHPSWEAKKKLPTIANFQGKKITFD